MTTLLSKKNNKFTYLLLSITREYFFWKQVRISQFLLTSLGKNLIVVVITTNTGLKISLYSMAYESSITCGYGTKNNAIALTNHYMTSNS